MPNKHTFSIKPINNLIRKPNVCDSDYMKATLTPERIREAAPAERVYMEKDYAFYCMKPEQAVDLIFNAIKEDQGLCNEFYHNLSWDSHKLVSLLRHTLVDETSKKILETRK